MDDEGYLESIVGMFEADIKAIAGLEAAARVAFLDRLDKVRSRCRGFGYGIGDPSTTYGRGEPFGQNEGDALGATFPGHDVRKLSACLVGRPHSCLILLAWRALPWSQFSTTMPTPKPSQLCCGEGSASMTKADLVERLAQEKKMARQHAELLVDTVLACIEQSLVPGRTDRDSWVRNLPGPKLQGPRVGPESENGEDYPGGSQAPTLLPAQPHLIVQGTLSTPSRQ
jgi:hypothetical protein